MEGCHDLMTGPDMGQVQSHRHGSSIRDNGFGEKENLFSDTEKAQVRVIIVITCNF